MPLPLAAIPLIAGGVFGAGQLLAGLTMKKGEQPQFEIPQGAQDALATSQRLASQTELPSANMAREMMKRNAANSIYATTQAATSPNQILSSVKSINDNLNQGEQNLALQGANYYAQNQQQLMGQQNNMAQWQNQKWISDKYNPYMMNLQRKQSLIQGGLNNLTMGAQGTVNALLANPSPPKAPPSYNTSGNAPANFNFGSPVGYNPIAPQQNQNWGIGMGDYNNNPYLQNIV